MNINDLTKMKLSSNGFLSKKVLTSDGIVNPKRDWNILMISFVVFVAASVAFDYYMYQQTVSGDMYVSVDKTELVIVKLKSDDLKSILANFETKKSKITTLKINNLIDPSI